MTKLARQVPSFALPGNSVLRATIAQDIANLVVHLVRKLDGLVIDTDPGRRDKYVTTLDQAAELLDKVRVAIGDDLAEHGEDE